MARMQAVYYRAADGSEPVDEFVEQLADAQKQVAIHNQIDRLNMLRPNDPPLPFPWSSQLEGEYALRLGALPGHLPPLAQPLRPLAHVQKGHGSVLYSRPSRPLMTIVEETLAPTTSCTRPAARRCSRSDTGYPLRTRTASRTSPPRWPRSAYRRQRSRSRSNIFMNVVVRSDGTLSIHAPISTAGQGLTFVAERDVVVSVSACSAASANGGKAQRPLLAEIRAASWQAGCRPTTDDPSSGTGVGS
jgi:Domain of unknown function (DUF1989)